MKLSKPQERFLLVLEACSTSVPPADGQRDAGRRCSAWHRTAESLRDRGLVHVRRKGNGYVATLTPLGQQWLKSRWNRAEDLA
jgi:hypothetical protein